MKKLNRYKMKIWMIILIILMQVILLVLNIIRGNALTKLSFATDNISSNTDKIHFLALGDSDSILIESNGHYGLVDTSNPSNASWNIVPKGCGDYRSSTYNGKKVAEYLNNLGVKELDFVIGTHSHSDHIGGIIDICNAEQYLESSTGETVDFITENTTYIYKKYNLDSDVTPAWNNEGYYKWALNAMEKEGAKFLEVQDHSNENLKQINSDAKFIDNKENSNDYIEFTFENYNIKIFNLYTVNTREENVNSLVVLITKGNTKTLLMADMNTYKKTEQKIAEFIGEVDLIKIGHHGYEKSTSMELLNITKPKMAVVTTAGWKDNLNPASYYLKQNSGKLYLTAKANKAIVAEVGMSDINLKTYDGDGNLNKNPTTSEATMTGWMYSYANYTDKTWIYVDYETENLIKGWRKIKYNGTNYWFYFAETNLENFCPGEMVTGLQKIAYDDKERSFYFSETATDYYCTGALTSGWQKLNYGKKNYWFYFSKTATDDFKYGEMLTGWHQITYKGENCWFYFLEEETKEYCKGEMATGWQVINKSGYYFNENGVLQGKDEKAPNINNVSINITGWTNENVTITVNAEDEEVGLDEEAYSFDGGLTWQKENTKTYTSNIDNIVIKVRDAGGNISEYTPISITNIVELKSIKVTKVPNKIIYIEGDTFKSEGMEITAIYNNGDTKVITDYKVIDGENLLAKKTNITISYTENEITKTVVQDITVLEKLKIRIKEYEEEMQDSKNYIKNIKVNETIENLKEKIATNGEIKIYQGETEITDKTKRIATGMEIKITLNEESQNYLLIVTGDVNGDAKVDLSDILAINKHRLNKVALLGEKLLAGDVNNDGKTDLNDILQINKFRLGKIENL